MKKIIKALNNDPASLPSLFLLKRSTNVDMSTSCLHRVSLSKTVTLTRVWALSRCLDSRFSLARCLDDENFDNKPLCLRDELPDRTVCLVQSSSAGLFFLIICKGKKHNISEKECLRSGTNEKSTIFV